MIKKALVTGTGIGIMLVAGCATISEDDCMTGAWAEYGYKDGINGQSSAKISDYAKKCGEFGVAPDMDAYLSGHAQGVSKYCTYERGYATGEDGGAYNQVCTGLLATDYAPGYDSGRVVFDIMQEYQGLIRNYDDTQEALVEVRRKLDEDALEDGERKRLRKKRDRLRDERDDIRIDIRAFERIHDLPRQAL